MKALAKKAEDRYADVAELAAALAPFAEHRGTQLAERAQRTLRGEGRAMTAGSISAMTSVVPGATTTIETEAMTTHRFVRSRTRGVILASLGALALVTAVAGWSAVHVATGRARLAAAALKGVGERAAVARRDRAHRRAPRAATGRRARAERPAGVRAERAPRRRRRGEEARVRTARRRRQAAGQALGAARRRSARDPTMTRPLLALALVAALGFAKAARADETVRRDPAAAEALWQQGRALRAAGKIAEACPKFEASYKLDPALGALLNLASCHELQGRIGTAWAEYKDAEEQAERAGDKKRLAFAKKRAAALEARVPRLEIVAANPPAGLVVTRDGQPLGAGALGTMLPVDPGVHTVEVRAPGRAAWKRKIELLAGERQTIDVPVLATVETPAEPAPVAVVAPPVAAPLSPPPSSSGAKTAGLVLGGVGVAGLAVGAVFGLLTGSAASSARPHCPNDACDATGLADVDRAKTDAWVSDVGFVAGGAALVAGVVLIVTARPTRPATSGLSLTPIATPGGGGLGARGSF